jgi:prepilin-type processing-associated H-X9-DG protein
MCAPSFTCRGDGARRRGSAFTLVELLVVIGIIALLISILLPALSKARRSALTVKCSSALRQIGMAYQLYASEQKGWYPVAKYTPGSSKPYNIDGNDFTGTLPAYWINFIAKYVDQSKIGYAVVSGVDSQQARKGILWGCPAWQGYMNSTTVSGVYDVQTGYGMNGWPTFTPDSPPAGTAFPPPNDIAVIASGGTTAQTGKFYKQSQWNNLSAERALVMDSRFWFTESNPAPQLMTYPPCVVSQPVVQNTQTYTASDQTMADIYRHGSYPKSDGAVYNVSGGAVGFNILYCDGHVSTENDGKPAYKSLRMRFPG